MPHVAVLFEFPTLNGGERSMLAVLSELSRRAEFRFSAITPGDGDLAQELRLLNIPLCPLTIRQNGTKLPAEQLHQQLKQITASISPDVLHSNSLSMSRLSGQVNFSDQPELIRTGHLRDIIKLNATVISDLNANDALVAVSGATRDFHVGQGLSSDRCHVIHNGVDTENFQPRDKDMSRSEVLPNVSSDAVVLLNVGQICLRKGQLALAEAVCRQLRDRNEIHLVVAGERHSTKAESIAFESAIHAAFATIGKTDHLHMLGYRNDVHRLMNAADVLVHAARQEPFGRTLLEAAASGLPIVATDVGGTSELLRHNQDAILVTPDSEAMAVIALELFDDPNRKQQLANSAQQRIQNHFTAQNAADRLGEFWSTASQA